MYTMQQIVELMTPGEREIWVSDWNASRDPRISLDFISQTIGKYPWNLRAIITMPKPGYVEFMSKHSALFAKAVPRDEYVGIFSIIPFIEILPMLNRSNVFEDPDLLDCICLNPDISPAYILVNVNKFDDKQWEYISKNSKRIVELYQLIPEKLKPDWICMNHHVTEELIRQVTAVHRVDSIYSPNLSIAFIMQHIDRYFMIDWHLHPGANLSNYPDSYGIYNVLANPGVRQLDLLRNERCWQFCVSYSDNPNVTPEFMCLNLCETDWDSASVLRQVPIDLVDDELMNRPEIFSPVRLGEHPDITVGLFLKYRRKIDMAFVY